MDFIPDMNRREFLGKFVWSAAALYLADSLLPETAESAKKIISNKQYLLTDPVFDEQYRIVGGAAERVAAELFPNSLQKLVDYGIIVRDIEDLSLPLGIRYGRKNVDYCRGMEDMWNRKRGINRNDNQGKILRDKRDQILEKMKGISKKSSLRKYRDSHIANATSITLREVHEGRRRKADSYKAGFMDQIVKMITPNVLLGYNVQELIPPAINREQINPVFKEYFFNRLLIEGGEEFVEGYPARYDPYMSYGPFQLTYKAMPQVCGLNKCVSGNNQVPDRVQDLRGLKDHCNAAVMFAYSNWEILTNYLGRKKLLKKFDKAFENLDERERQIIVAGLTACMHNKPSKTNRRVANYVSTKDGKNMHYDLRRVSLTGHLQKYYDSAAEAYLLAKVFHTLEGRYSR